MIKHTFGLLVTVIAFLLMLPMWVAQRVGLIPVAPVATEPARRTIRTARRKGYESLIGQRRAWFAAPMRASNWGELLIPSIYNFFDIGRQLRPHLRSTLFNVQTSTRDREESVGYGGIAPDAFDTYKNSGQKGSVSFDQGYKTTYQHVEYPVTFTVERRLMDDDQYGVMAGERARKLGLAAEQKMERDAAAVFNNAFSSSYPGGDGKALCSTTHPRNPNKSGNLVNKGTSALTADAVESTRIEMETTEDDAGNILGMMPDTILVPPALRNKALEIANSPLDPESANNAINPEAGTYNVIAWPHLTDSNNWFMIDSVWMGLSLKWYDRVGPEITLTHQTSTEAMYDLYMRYSYGWDDWRWIYGHEVA